MLKAFRTRFSLLLIFVITFLSVYIAIPRIPINLNLWGMKLNTTLNHPDIDWKIGNLDFDRDLEPKLGLDLQGGTHLVLSADMKNIKAEDRETALESAKNVIERRVDFFGVSEPLIQTAKVGDDYRVIVEIAGITDVNKAKDLIGTTAQLEFRERKPEAASEPISTIENTVPTGFTGADLLSASVQYAEGSLPVVGFKTTPEGAKKLGEITTRLQGKQMPIFLDNIIVSDPVVNSAITEGEGIIQGMSSLDQAKNLTTQLNAGALPVPVKIVEERTIGATLGNESVQKSLLAGVVGVVTVSLFMLFFYGRFGIIAVLALLIYTALNLAIFKLYPVTLTLAGIAGFILSIGMAVDANILTFERIREELRAGQKYRIALEVGFKRAWSSIRDSNISSLITCGILMYFGTGIVKSFAVTLFIGILTSMFTAIVVSRTLLRTFRGKGG